MGYDVVIQVCFLIFDKHKVLKDGENAIFLFTYKSYLYFVNYNAEFNLVTKI